MGNMSGTSGSHYTLWQSITQNWQKVEENYTNVTVRMYLSFDGSSWYAYTNNRTYGNMNVKGNNIDYNIASINFSSGQAKDLLLAEWTGNIYHNDDGTKTLNVSGYWNTNTTRMGEGWCSASLQLTTIPRKSTASMVTAPIGTPTNITISGATDNFTHTIKLTLGNLTITALSGKKRGTHPWTVDTRFYAQTPKKSATGTLTCETYNGSTLIGTTTSSFTVTTLEDQCRPIVSGTVVDTNQDTLDVTQNPNVLVLYKSNAKVTFTATPRNSATITSKTINGQDIGTATGKTYNSTTLSQFTLRAVDSREYATEYVAKATSIVNYVPLTVNFNAFRPQPTTGEISVNFSGNYYNGSFGARNNTLRIKLEYQEVGTSKWILIHDNVNKNIYNDNTYSSIGTLSQGNTFDYQKSYIFKITVTDQLSTAISQAQVPGGETVFDWGKNDFRINKPLGAPLRMAHQGIEWKENGYGDKFKVVPYFGGVDDSNELQIWSAVGGAGTDPDYVKNLLMQGKSGNIWNRGSINSVKGFRSTDVGQAGTPVGNGMLIIKKVNNTEAPNNGVVLEYGNSTSWVGQLYIGDNSYQGIYYNGWADGVRGSWRRLADAPVTLYDNASGTNGTVNLSASVTSYSFIEIFMKDNNNGNHSSVKVPSNSPEITLSMTSGWDNTHKEIRVRRVYFSGTQIITSPNSTGYIDFNGLTIGGSYGDNYIYIYKVLGYR